MGETVKKQPNQYITAPLIPVVGGDKPGRPYGPSPIVRNVSVGPMDLGLHFLDFGLSPCSSPRAAQIPP